MDLISRQAAIGAINSHFGFNIEEEYGSAVQEVINGLPSAQPETCEGCKHLGKWENEIEYGYPSPCTHCKRRADDHYER